MALYVAFGVAYATQIPKWNAPDEPAHFNYVRHVATTGTLPILQLGDYDQAYLLHLTTTQFPDDLSIDGLRYESHQPPLYYVLAAGVFRAVEGASLDHQVLALRLFSVLLGALALVAGYALARVALPNHPLLALGAVAFAAGVPMHIAINASVNNDILGQLLLTLALLVAATGIRRGFSDSLCALLGVLVGAALLTKLTAYGVLVLAPVAVWAGRRIAPVRFGEGGGESRRRRPVDRVPALASAASSPLGARAGGAAGRPGQSAWRAVGMAFGGLAVRQLAIIYGVALGISGWWFARNALTYGGLDVFGLVRHDEVVLGQPQTVYNLAAVSYFLLTTFQSFWAQFGWMGVHVDSRIYTALALLCALAGFGFLIAAWRLFRRPERLNAAERWTLALLGLCVVLVVGQLVYYNLTFIQAQGRYLFPAIIPIGLFFTVGLLQLVPRFLAPAVLLGLYLALLAFDYISLVRFIVPYFHRL